MGIEVSDIALAPRVVLHQRYEICEVHYLGQTGIVYFGKDFQESREIVIKEFMPYSIANRDMDGKTVVCKGNGYKDQFQKFRKAFDEECECILKLKGLKKPYDGCVLKYLDSFTENGTRYLITEKIQGKSLQDYIENGEDYSVRLAMQQLVAIVRQIHKRGIIHCDIKPSNIILDHADQHVTLIDFGSASFKKKEPGDMFFVSRGYSAPELYHGEKIDYRADIYSIGAVLYYVLTDSQLPEPDDYDQQEDIPPISNFIEIPPSLEKVILSALNRDKKKRLKSIFLLQIMLQM